MRLSSSLTHVHAGLSEEYADCAIARFAEANFSRISNKSGFLMGIIRRVQDDGPDRGNEDLDLLPRSVRTCLFLCILLPHVRQTERDIFVHCSVAADKARSLHGVGRLDSVLIVIWALGGSGFGVEQGEYVILVRTYMAACLLVACWSV